MPGEQVFRSTLRNCLGAACFTETPAGAGVDARIALLAPPSAAARAVFGWYRSLLATTKKPKLEWVETSHAPPYGYGKNHGYTRIVRLALPLAVASNVTALKQHVRWHCRVSHVAAHTAMLTLEPRDFEDVATRRMTAERLLSFAGVKVSHDALAAAEQAFGPAGTAVDAAVDAARAAVSRAGPALDAALAGELKATKTLQAWPCRSLWVDKAGDAAAAARALAPDCGAPFTTCSVPRDKQEMAGAGPPEP